MADISILLRCIAYLLVFSWILRLAYSVWWKPKKLEKFFKQQGVVGPPYRLLFGNLKEFLSSMKEAQLKPMNLSHKIIPRVAPFFENTMLNYGKTSITWFGPSPRIHIMDPEMIKEILTNKFGQFEKPEVNPQIKLLLTGVAILEGEKWAKHRRIINPAFHMEKIKRMLPAFSASCCELISRWEKSVGSEGSFELDVWPEIQNLTGDVISRAAFGSNYKEGNRIFQLQREQAKYLVEAADSVYIPGFRFLPTKKNRRRQAIDREVRALVTSMIKKREKATKLGEAPRDDLLGLLLESNWRESQEQGNSKGMTTEEVIRECKLFYFAGQETTAVLLTWTLIVLGMHPTWQERARDEVLEVFGKKKPEFDGLSQLKIVTMILYEVLRLYPPLVFLLRSVNKDMKLGGISLPAGMEIVLPTLLVHHDRDLWGKDAEEFNPERFAEGIAKATNNKVSFIPFGWGPRICVGQNFAFVEAKIVLAMILQNFLFELSPSYAHAPHSLVTIHPQHGAQIIFHKL
ncbi:cytochrome P450 CYP72A616-like [Aristolochia californica]|uniref:cytochrome P450 CYP72A616-like n=1 Tax=Aristolochia californica TaxID=171875 RepID=UPI0035E2B0DB